MLPQKEWRFIICRIAIDSTYQCISLDIYQMNGFNALTTRRIDSPLPQLLH